jgi:hypothetical protein
VRWNKERSGGTAGCAHCKPKKRSHVFSQKGKISFLIVVFIPLASILDVKNNSEI